MSNYPSTQKIVEALDKKLITDLGDRNDYESVSRNVPSVHAEFIRLSYDEALRQQELKAEWDKLYRDKYEYYRYNYKYVFNNKAECDVFINGDEDIIAFKKKLNKSKIIMDHLEQLTKMLEKISFNIRNALEAKKMEGGSYL